jgi:hypothetical protein
MRRGKGDLGVLLSVGLHERAILTDRTPDATSTRDYDAKVILH